MSHPKKPRLLPRLFEGAGYMMCLLQWLWVMILILPALLESGLITSLLPKVTEHHASQHIATGPPSPVLILVGGIVTILMLALSVFVLLKFPSTVAKTGTAITHKSADAIVPVVTHHKVLPAKKRRLITGRVLFYIKLLLVLVPLAACFAVPIDAHFSRTLVVFIGSFLATIALSLFGLEHATRLVQSR